MALLDEIAKAHVTAEQLEQAAAAVEREREEGGDAPVELVVMREFGRKTLEPVVFAAILFRMEALARAIQDQTTEKWTIEIEGKGYSLVPENIFVAAAGAPLRIDNPDGPKVQFDPVEFLRLALDAAEPEGRA